MKSQTDQHRREQYVDETGNIMERLDIPRMAGKIFGFLLLSKEAEVSTDDLVLHLQASRGSVSTMTRLLIQRDLVEKTSRRGERKDYFRIKPGMWSKILESRMAQLIEFHDLIEEGITLVGSGNPIPYHRLKEMHEFYSFFEKEFPNLFERWEQHQKQLKKV
jgi:DNA-binding transcriptional regulator GbsR (MarR family)